jgi:coenzyme F420-reducing hydrogenase gamma subunit
MECKRRGSVCVMVASGTPCLGPVTQAGCGAICPAFNRGCYACFGPAATTNTDSLAHWFEREGTSRDAVVRMFRSYNAAAEPFRKQSEAHGH